VVNKDLPKLLRAIASGTQAKQNSHDIILKEAARELELLRMLLRVMVRKDVINTRRMQSGENN
jgi:hypothetical protein